MCGVGDVAGHAAEDDGVERRDGGPVGVAGESAGEEHGTLVVSAVAGGDGFGPHLQPGSAG